MTKQKHIEYHFSKFNFLSIKKFDPFVIKKNRKTDLWIEFFNFHENTFDDFNHSFRTSQKNDFDKKITLIASKSVMINENPQWIMNQILKKEMREKIPKYIIKWKKYKEIIWKKK